jgi:ATP-binding cassette subfamily B protein
MSYLTQLYDPLRTIGQRVAKLQASLASAERTFDLLDETPEVTEQPNARALDRAAGAIAFEEVGFSYAGGDLVLRDLTFEVPAGNRVGLAGRTGSGKSTLVGLLPRFFDPEAGGVRLDGTDLRAYRIEDLRRQFSIVLQEPVLFRTSLAENIGYGRPGASRKAIEKAARAAEVHRVIANLPEGYDTVVGERGMQLSGGERQRVALARAFLKDAPLLILDEPTSAVDVETERGILDAIDRLMAGRTVFMITHRLETLRGCDQLLVLENGRLVAQTDRVADFLDDGELESILGTPTGSMTAA